MWLTTLCREKWREKCRLNSPGLRRGVAVFRGDQRPRSLPRAVGWAAEAATEYWRARGDLNPQPSRRQRVAQPIVLRAQKTSAPAPQELLSLAVQANPPRKNHISRGSPIFGCCQDRWRTLIGFRCTPALRRRYRVSNPQPSVRRQFGCKTLMRKRTPGAARTLITLR